MTLCSLILVPLKSPSWVLSSGFQFPFLQGCWSPSTLTIQRTMPQPQRLPPNVWAIHTHLETKHVTFIPSILTMAHLTSFNPYATSPNFWLAKKPNGFFPCRTWPPVLAPTSASTPVASHRPMSRWCPMIRTEGRSGPWRQNGQGVAKWCTPALDPFKVGACWSGGRWLWERGRILFEVALVGLVEKYSSNFPQFLRGMIAACFNRWPFGVSRNSEFVHNFTDSFLLLQNFIYTPNISLLTALFCHMKFTSHLWVLKKVWLDLFPISLVKIG